MQGPCGGAKLILGHAPSVADGPGAMTGFRSQNNGLRAYFGNSAGASLSLRR